MRKNEKKTHSGLCLTAVKTDRGRAAQFFRIGGAARGVVTYSVENVPVTTSNRRREKRRDVRLQSGKIIDQGEQFVVECLFRNIGETGCMLRLRKSIGLPNRIRVYDDVAREILSLLVVWRRGPDIGCRIIAPRRAASERLMKRLEGPFYAVQ